jgi:hypothetical protein
LGDTDCMHTSKLETSIVRVYMLPNLRYKLYTCFQTWNVYCIHSSKLEISSVYMFPNLRHQLYTLFQTWDINCIHASKLEISSNCMHVSILTHTSVICKIGLTGGGEEKLSKLKADSKGFWGWRITQSPGLWTFSIPDDEQSPQTKWFWVNANRFNATCSSGEEIRGQHP